ncbi:hypothetical protein ABZY81_42160 [Streptomyces sp. NPDC006514]|uniref:hypothetical protein n=1 Tax=Streptomyces sp. NPDC006514 TaxID=3154308 RepID=UPI00339FDFB7
MDPDHHTPLRAVALVRTPSPSPAPSSSQLPAEQTMAAFTEHGVTGKTVRIADLAADTAHLAHLARRPKAAPHPAS